MNKEAELTVAPEVLAELPLDGMVVTGDALYTQRNLCEQIIAQGGDYLFIVKLNQPTLYQEIVLVFDDPPQGEVFSFAQQQDRHGDRHELRRLWASGALMGYSQWPGMQQVCKVERQVERKGKRKADVRYAVTSLGSKADAGRLLRLIRGHWSIENQLHWVRDVTLGEDASQIRKSSAPEVMAAIRNVVLALLRRGGAKNIAAALRQNGWQRNGTATLAALLSGPFG